MATLNKTTISKDLKELLSTILECTPKTKHDEVNTNFNKLLTKYEPKSGGGQVKHPMYEENGINYHYCRYIQEYRTEEEMVMSNGKSKGYTKEAIARWTKMGKEAKSLQNEALKCLLTKCEDPIEQKETNDKGHELNEKAEDLLLSRNKPEAYSDLKINEPTIEVSSDE